VRQRRDITSDLLNYPACHTIRAGTLTPKGQATRARIIEGAGQVLRETGVAFAALDGIRAHAGTSKSQLSRYFPRGKEQLLLAVAQYEADRVRPGPAWGIVGTHESTRKLACRLDNATARILPAAVSRTAQRWFVSFTAGVERAVPRRHGRPGSLIGVDPGVRTLLTGVDDRGNVVTAGGPQPLRVSASAARRGD
jgi:AcrR family transcriptional regulator